MASCLPILPAAGFEPAFPPGSAAQRIELAEISSGGALTIRPRRRTDLLACIRLSVQPKYLRNAENLSRRNDTSITQDGDQTKSATVNQYMRKRSWQRVGLIILRSGFDPLLLQFATRRGAQQLRDPNLQPKSRLKTVR